MINNLTNREYQIQVADKLRAKLSLSVQTEWRSMQEQKSLYCPRVDIAVGPFVYDSSSITDEHDQIVKQWENSIKSMLDYHKYNVQNLSWEICRTSIDKLCCKNKTARCFLAIEIENKVSRKHMIGSALNAMALGRLGIIIACTPEKLRAFVKLRRYLWFLSRATNIDTDNLLILNKEQFIDSFNIHL